MSRIKETREFFLRDFKKNHGKNKDNELGFPILNKVKRLVIKDGVVTEKYANVYNRFLEGHVPSSDVWAKLLESVVFHTDMIFGENGTMIDTVQDLYDIVLLEGGLRDRLLAIEKDIYGDADIIGDIGLIDTVSNIQSIIGDTNTYNTVIWNINGILERLDQIDIILENLKLGGTDPDPDPDPFVSVGDITTMTVGSDESTVTIYVQSNTGWAITTNVDWISISGVATGTGNATVFVVVGKNMTVSRIGRVTVTTTTGDKTAHMDITQERAIIIDPDPDLYISVGHIHIMTVGSEAGTAEINVESNTSWNVTTDATWISIGGSTRDGNATLLAVVTKNMNTTSRTGRVTCTTTTGGKTAYMDIKQDGRTEEPDPDLYITIKHLGTINVESEGGTANINVESNTDWNVATNVNWISISGSATRQGDATLYATVTKNIDPNTRTGTVTCTTTGGKKESIDIKQDGRLEEPTNSVTLDKDLIEVNDRASTESVKVTFSGSGSLAVTGGDGWATPSETSLSVSPTTITIDIDAWVDPGNEQSRQTTLLFKIGTAKKTLTIIQSGGLPTE